jgi:hypothetical protein
MRLTYEQHQELLELATYLAKVRRNALRQGLKIDEIIGKSIEQDEKQSIHVLKNPERKRF